MVQTIHSFFVDNYSKQKINFLIDTAIQEIWLCPITYCYLFDVPKSVIKTRLDSIDNKNSATFTVKTSCSSEIVLLTKLQVITWLLEDASFDILFLLICQSYTGFLFAFFEALKDKCRSSTYSVD